MGRPQCDTIMVAYDGGPNADRAIGYAAHYLSATTCHVVTAWETGMQQSARLSTYSGGMQPLLDTRFDSQVDAALLAEAEQTNARGVDLARQAGLTATGRMVEVTSTVWGTLVHAADDLDVDVLVIGTRGASGLKALLRSSVAERVLKHCHRPVLVVPAGCGAVEETAGQN
ncbi:universal stress protein [Williamsia sterculiae]|uniref:Nucleotide-binding universal stress protein, UspA family n=1 Tax=Williamsia sterculiae TaxID=1344003 RepID=A0A1N7CEC8_9NOCA|nr:universal stress protein [Williamsia sterculiae]SIR61968.1 Nucleotide-binding universal stress protein, UspA family [Williamsia sterculiae]